MLYLYSQDQQDLYCRLFKEALPDWTIASWPQEVEAEAVTHVAVWAPPAGFFRRFPNLRAVFVMGAGVDQLLGREDAPVNVDIFRITDAGMARQMTEYCLYGVLHYQRQMDIYQQQQRAKQWRPLQVCRAENVRISVLGLGQLGVRVAQDLARMGYQVSGWSRRPKHVEGVFCLDGDVALRTLLTQTDILFCVLPATPETRNLLNSEYLSLLPREAAIINAGRGSLIDQNALLAHLNGGNLRFVLLDVVAEEPLERTHPLWLHPRVMITPHIAADAIPEEVVSQIAANIHASTSGMPVSGYVDRVQGY